MRIDRLRVEEGFLDGLDVRFSPGLNVIIGPRGCGKTSVIELIRFCLGVPSYSEKAQRAAERHALDVLGGGRVSVNLTREGRTETISRTADTRAGSVGKDAQRPIILSQNQIEILGLEGAQRLRLLDEFSPSVKDHARKERQLAANINSLSSEIAEKRAELALLTEQMDALAEAPAELTEALKEEQKSSGHLAELEPVRKDLGKVAAQAAEANVEAEAISYAMHALQEYEREISRVRRSLAPLPPWPDSAGEVDRLENIRTVVGSVHSHIIDAAQAVAAGKTALSELIEQNAAERDSLERAHLSLRKSVEAAQAGAGEAAKRVAGLRSQVARLAAQGDLRKVRQGELDALVAERAGVLDDMDRVRQERYAARASATRALNDQLGPTIRVQVAQYGSQSGYADELTSLLRGSGLHYAKIVPTVTTSVSPRELVDAVEHEDASAVADLTGIAEQRISKMLSHLATAGAARLLAVSLEDSVSFSLLDGRDYKPAPRLSTGQRCTVVLPIFLAHPTRPVLVDQPEDHLDNAFVVDTLVKSLRARSRDGDQQLILTTHNANIPVLGEADHVVRLGSDGRRGFVLVADRLDAPEIVEAISDVMEGGREAFERRAKFYRDAGA